MDEDPLLYHYIVLGILLLFSFYFSGTETAVFSLNRLERNTLKKTKAKRLKNVLGYILDHQEQLLITILTGNMIVNIFASGIGEIIGARLFGHRGELFSIIAMTLLLLFFGELTPKRIAVMHSKGFSRTAALPLYFFHRLFTPVRWILNRIAVIVLNLFPVKVNPSDEKKHAVVLSTAELGFQENILHQSEYRLFKSYITFKEKSAQSVMIPRSELKTVAWDTTVGEALELIGRDPCYMTNSSVLVFEEDNDHLVGWVPLAALLIQKFAGTDLDKPVGSLAKKFHAVPDSKDLPTLITELREAETDIVLLVDEYGGTAGVVWFRNIIEDVLKAFYAPYKEQYDKQVIDYVTVPGSMPLEEFEELYDISVDRDCETVAGMFLELKGEIPVEGDELHFGGIVFRVVRMEGNKITEIGIETESVE